MNLPALELEDLPPSKLGKTLLARHVAMISIGGIIGAGLFVGSSAAIASAGPAIILSYAIAGFLVLLVMRMLGEMALLLPGISSFTEFSRIGLGSWAGFTSGWLYWYFWIVVVAIEAIAGANLIRQWIDLPMWLIGWILLAVLTATNLFSARTYGELEFWFASFKVGAIVAFIVVAGAYVAGIGSGGVGVANLTAHGGFAPMGMTAVLAGVTTVIFSLTGAEIATIAAAESPEPARTIAKLTNTVVLRIVLFYVGSIFLIVCIVPWNEIVPGQSPFVAAMQRINIPAAAPIMNFIVLTAVLSCLNSGLYVTSRVLFTLASRGDAPQAVVKLSNRQVPARAILLGSVFGYLAILASVLSPEGVFKFLVDASGATMLIIYIMVALAEIRIRRHVEKTSPEKLTFKVWFFPYSTYLAIAGMGAVLLAMAITPELTTQFYVSALLFVLVIGAFFVFRKKRA